LGHCANGCLFELNSDPLESVDLAAAKPLKLRQLYAKLEKYETTAFNPNRGGVNPAACQHALTEYGGFWGPFLP